MKTIRFKNGYYLKKIDCSFYTYSNLILERSSITRKFYSKETHDLWSYVIAWLYFTLIFPIRQNNIFITHRCSLTKIHLHRFKTHKNKNNFSNKKKTSTSWKIDTDTIFFRSTFIPSQFDPPTKRHSFAWLCMKYGAHSPFEQIPPRVDELVGPWESWEASETNNPPSYVGAVCICRGRNACVIYRICSTTCAGLIRCIFYDVCVVLYWNGCVYGWVLILGCRVWMGLW